MNNFITGIYVIAVIYLISLCQIDNIMAAPTSNENLHNSRNRARGTSRYHSRAAQYGRVKPDTFINDLGDDDDLFDLSKRQQPNSDDYGHLRFGKRDDQFDDYGHMRFGRNGGEKK